MKEHKADEPRSSMWVTAFLKVKEDALRKKIHSSLLSQITLILKLPQLQILYVFIKSQFQFCKKQYSSLVYKNKPFTTLK